MGENDKYPTVGEILNGDAPFPTSQAAHNEQGMYAMPDTEGTTGSDDMVQTDSGLWLPRPTQKQVTRLHFKYGLVIDVSEPLDTVLDKLSDLRQMEAGSTRIFTAPVFNDPVLVTSEAAKELLVISVEYRDLKEVEAAERAKQHNLAVQDAMITQQRAQMLGAQNHGRRR